MAYSYVVYTGNGATTQYSVPFPYIRKEHVYVSINYTNTTAFTWVNASTIQMNSAPANGARVEVRRTTPVTAPLVDFADGSTLVAADLDTVNLQQTYINQEQDDQFKDAVFINAQGNLDANGKRITNVGNPTAAQDAATKSYADNWFNTYGEVYLGSYAADPATKPNGGALTAGVWYFNTATSRIRIYTGQAWTDGTVPGSLTRWKKTAAGGETSLSGADDNSFTLAYTPALEQLYINGALQTRAVDYLATNGTSVTGLAALTAGDVVEVLSFNSWVVATVPDASVTNAKVATGAGIAYSKLDITGSVVNADVNASAGIAASKLTFTQAGASAVQRTVEAKLQDVVSVKDFGAVGNGVTDDTAAIQAAINEAMKTGKLLLIEGPGPYLISSKLVVKITRDAGPTDATPASDVHFTDTTSAYILGLGMPTLKATASMTAILELIFDTSDSDVGPFYSKVEGIGFDGNGFATSGIKSDYTMHVTIERNRFWGLSEGVSFAGYGVATITQNVIRATYGIRFVGGGGDSTIYANDFYSPSGVNSACVRVEWYGGNTRVFSNVFTNEFGSGNTTYGVQLLGTTAAGSQEVRDVIVSSNEFCGFTTAIRADAKSAAIKNIYRIVITANRTLPYSATNAGQLLAAVNCQELHVTDNLCNSVALVAATSTAIELVSCERCKLAGNKIQNYTGLVLGMTNCVDTEVVSNTFIDCATTGTSYVCVGLYGGSSARNYFKDNYFRQSSGSYGQYGILEDTGVNNTFSFDNTFDGLNRPHTKVGANSIMRRTEYLAAAPTSGSYYVGDIVWNTAPAAGGAPGWICTTSGIGTAVFKAMANLAP